MTTSPFGDLLNSCDGEEWDTVNMEVTIPAGATSLTVQPIPRDDFNTGRPPASLTWVGAGLSVPLDCLDCGFGGDNANKISVLTLKYNGANGSDVRVRNGGKAGDPILFEGTLNNGDEFTLRASDILETKFKNDVKFYAVSNGGQTEIAKLHTSCSKPVGPGTVVGDFEVTAAQDADSVNLCPASPPGACQECQGGVVELTLRYDGPGGNLVVMADGKNGTETYNVGAVATGDTFTIVGTKSDGKFEGNELEFFVDLLLGDGPELVAVLHVSCSDVIGPGTTEQDGNKHEDPNGQIDFTVVEAFSRDNGLVCPVTSSRLSVDDQQTAPELNTLAETPEAPMLEPAYPNPFNPTTTIRFSLSQASEVRLIVFDILGRKVRVLVDGNQPAGTHTVTFDASDLPSGTYLYHLETAFGTQSGTMLLVK